MERNDVSDEASNPRQLPEQLRDAINRLHYSARTEERYVHWVKRFIYFSGKRHPAELGAAEVTRDCTEGIQLAAQGSSL
ncbi:MAG TPA: phage integrase N-terminal SAM-like domain-containing protein [Burkholderiales bacterium]|nr:phage integrase N-terminal SAM-like domain-containing protein [Burkholderiales bacterium]